MPTALTDRMRLYLPFHECFVTRKLSRSTFSTAVVLLLVAPAIACHPFDESYSSASS